MKKDINQLFVFPKTWMSKETGDIAKSVRQWANKEIVSRRLDYQDDYENQFPQVRRKLALDIGCQGLMFSDESGGLGFNTAEAATLLITILKEIGRADAAIGFIYAMEYTLSALLVADGGDRSGLQENLASRFCQETLTSAALILPASGPVGEVLSLFEGRPIRVQMTGGESGQSVSGNALRPLDLGSEAAVFGVVCVDAAGRPGVGILTEDAGGLARGENVRKTGLDGCRNTDIDLNRAPLPEDHLFSGESAIRALYAWLNLLLGAVSTGAAMGCLEVAGEWSEERVIKAGGRIKDNPLCASVLAEAYEEVAVSWTLLHHLAYALAHPREWGEAGSPLIFSQAQMTGRRVQAGTLLAVNKMMELMASEGYAREGRIEKAWRDIKTIQSALCGVGGEAPVRLDVARYVFDSQIV